MEPNTDKRSVEELEGAMDLQTERIAELERERDTEKERAARLNRALHCAVEQRDELQTAIDSDGTLGEHEAYIQQAQGNRKDCLKAMDELSLAVAERDALREALEKIRDMGGECIYSHSEDFRAGSHTAFARCAGIAAGALADHPAEAPAEQAVRCLDCNAAYGGTGWCDVVIPNEIWNEICPKGGVLCFRCMTIRIEHAGLRNVPVAIASGPYSNRKDCLKAMDELSLAVAERDALRAALETVLRQLSPLEDGMRRYITDALKNAKALADHPAGAEAPAEPAGPSDTERRMDKLEELAKDRGFEVWHQGDGRISLFFNAHDIAHSFIRPDLGQAIDAALAATQPAEEPKRKPDAKCVGCHELYSWCAGVEPAKELGNCPKCGGRLVDAKG